MNGFVLDCSVAITWVIEAEATPETDALMKRVYVEPVIVPELWHIEVANVLLQATKRKRLSSEQVEINMTTLTQMPLLTDDAMVVHAWGDIYHLAVRENLTVYDAVYLELAQRKKLPLATMDKALREAARRLGIKVLPEIGRGKSNKG